MHTKEKISALAVFVCGLDFLSREAATEGFPHLARNIRKVIDSVEKDCSDGKPIFKRIMENSEILTMLDLYHAMREAGVRDIRQFRGQLYTDDMPEDGFYPAARAAGKPN
jgi:hypothetical protein